jgi:CPA2 family monovalent cation:H+ antiporter-2
MEIPILKDISIIFALAVLVLWLFSHLRIPVIVGFILTGIISGPHGLKLIKHLTEVEVISKIGLLFLLFTIGLELSLKRLKNLKRYFISGGLLQVFLTTAVGFFIGLFLNRPVGEAVFLGFLLSMSSTAIALKALEGKGEVDSPQGQLSVGILIFQDIIAIPMILLVPFLAAKGNQFDMTELFKSLLGFLAVFITVAVAIKVVPRILFYIARTRVRELFSFTILTICFLVAWVASKFGLSLAIGAFLAGLIISESEYRHEAIGNIIPLQDIFSSLFFVSIGMLLDISFVLDYPLLILALSLAIIVMKAVLVGFTAYMLKMPLRVMIISALALSQIGEFSFVLVRAGMDAGLANDFLNQLFLAVALFTMALAPLLIAYADKWAEFILKKKFFHRHYTSHDSKKSSFKNHVLVIGYGLAGRNVVKALKSEGIPYTIIEMNPETVEEEKLKGEPIYFGDASHIPVLHHAGGEHAKTIALMINDPHALKRIIAHARSINPNAYLIVRTRYVLECETMYQSGATEVIPDEFGSSIEILTRILKKHEVADEKISRLAAFLRAENYIGIS